jgi:hypothetical protein
MTFDTHLNRLDTVYYHTVLMERKSLVGKPLRISLEDTLTARQTHPEILFGVSGLISRFQQSIGLGTNFGGYK